METEPSITAADARGFLAARFPEEIADVRPLAGGTWSQAFAFVADGRELVVRFGQHVGDYRKDQRAGGWRVPGVPIPQVLEVAEEFDAHFAISTLAHGQPLEDASPEQWAALVPRVLDLIDRFADLPAEGGGYGRWGPDGVAPHPTWSAFLLSVADDDDPTSRIHGWRTKLAHYPEADATFALGLGALEALTDGLIVPRRVVHADLTNRNVLVAGGAITAVLDWGSSLYGDPLYDVAWIAFWSPWQPNVAAVDIVEAARSSGHAFAGDADDFDRRITACELHIALDHVAYHAFAGHSAEVARLAQVVEELALP